jgi:hypothetical protein
MTNVCPDRYSNLKDFLRILNQASYNFRNMATNRSLRVFSKSNYMKTKGALNYYHWVSKD